MSIGQPRQFTTAGKWNGQAIFCHTATLFWLYEREFSRTPTLSQFSNLGFQFQGLMTALMGMGQRLQKPALGSTRLSSGTILIFELNGVAKHSCTAIDSVRTGGYNQTTWFSKPGIEAEYSTHETSEIKWHLGSSPLYTGGERPGENYGLFAVPDGFARALIRQAAQEG